jgi:hypothetical protein
MTMRNLRSTMMYRGLVAASAMSTLAAVVAAGKKW